MVFPYSVKEGAATTGIFQWLFKNAKKAIAQINEVLLEAPTSSLLLSQASSDIRFGDPALLCTDIKDCSLRNEYSVRFIITKFEQVVTH
jgi:hypothetical protein